MNNRISSVVQFNNVVVDTTSTIQIGDIEAFTPVVRGIAIQREKAVFFDQEFDIGSYPFYFRPFPHPVITENVHMTRWNESPVIQVKNVTIFRMLGASIAHIGSSHETRADARTKAIRHLLREPPS